MTFFKVNNLLHDFLGDLLLVFPDISHLGNAKKLIDAATALDESSSIPLLFFLGGHKIPAKNSEGETASLPFPRPMLGISKDGWTEMLESCSDANKSIILKYLQAIEKPIFQMADSISDLNEIHRKFVATDCFERLKLITSNETECDKILNDRSKLDSLLEAMQTTDGFAELSQGVQFIFDRIVNSPDMLIGLLSNFGEFKGTGSGDSGGGLDFQKIMQLAQGRLEI